jgi:hypothetical protein
MRFSTVLAIQFVAQAASKSLGADSDCAILCGTAANCRCKGSLCEKVYLYGVTSFHLGFGSPVW